MLKNEKPGAGQAAGQGQENYCFNNAGNDLDCQEKYLQAGLSIIPADPTTKKSTISWKAFQKAPMSQKKISNLSWPGVAIITGKVSGGLEILDFDYKAVLFDQWAAFVEAEAPGLVARLTRQGTQSGGKHIAYRCPGIKIPGNAKLASDKDGNCYIETRGEGGYFLAYPTPGYVLENSDFLNLPEITPGERNLLIKTAKALDKAAKPKYHKQPTIDGDRPGDIYNQQTDISALIEKHGWKPAGSRGDYDHWTRPGKDRGISGSIIDGKVFHVFTSNAAPLEQWTAYSPFSLYAALEHNGDFQAAAKDLWKQGFRGSSQNKVASEVIVQPLPLTRKTDPGEPYPIDALGDILGPACNVMTEIVQAPAAICAHALLSAACLCTQSFANIEIDGRNFPISEYFLSILGRSGRKSATDAIATAFIRQWERERLQEHQKAMSAYRDNFDAYEQQKRGILQNKKLSLHERQKQLAELRQHEPERPITPILLMSDNTYEGLVKSYIFGSPTKGLFADEGGLFTGGFSMSAEKMLYSAAGYSKFWDGSRVDRIRAGSEMEGLYGRRLTMHLMMQEQPAAEFFNNELLVNQGFMSRVFVACPGSLIGTRHYNTTDPNQTPEMQRFNDHIAALLEKDLPLKQDKKTGRVLNELEPRKIQLLQDAKALWVLVYEAIESESGNGSLFETIPGFAGKAAEHCLRLAGIMAVFENPDTRTVNKDQIKRASDLITYYLNERARIKAMSAPDLALIRAQELLAWLKDRKAETVILKEVYQKGPSKLRTADEARAAIKTLEDHFWLIPTVKKNEWRLQDAEV